MGYFISGVGHRISPPWLVVLLLFACTFSLVLLDIRLASLLWTHHIGRGMCKIEWRIQKWYWMWGRWWHRSLILPFFAPHRLLSCIYRDFACWDYYQSCSNRPCIVFSFSNLSFGSTRELVCHSRPLFRSFGWCSWGSGWRRDIFCSLTCKWGRLAPPLLCRRERKNCTLLVRWRLGRRGYLHRPLFISFCNHYNTALFNLAIRNRFTILLIIL